MNQKELSYTQLAKGTFLVASPEIESGIFYRSVVIICEHNLSGSFGLIINKEIDFELGESIIELEDLANPDVELLAGGPAQMNQMLLLHNGENEGSLPLIDQVSLGGDLEFLQQSLLNPEGPSIRLLFGYANWASGQLEKEFLNGQWFICSGQSKYIFETPVEKVWQRIMREMGGRFASLSMMPEDLSLN